MRKLTTEEFVKKAMQVHGGKYDYDCTIYISNSTKLKIKCPVHGLFEQLAGGHLSGKGCSKCSGKCKTLSTEDFIKEAKAVHGEKYTYAKAVYLSAHAKIVITCPQHGDFEQTASHHKKGHGCVSCARAKTNEQFIKDAIKVHGDLYEYSDSKYTGDKDQVIITCRIHGNFNQIASGHLQGNGCPFCGCSGFDKTKPGLLYYLKVTTNDNQVLYKIGITNRTVNERFDIRELQRIEIVKQKLYENGQDAWDWEQKLLKMYKQYQYKGPKVLVSGNTELFTEDILILYYENNSLSFETS